MAELYGIFKDLDACVGCYSCEVACKAENNLPAGTKWIQVVPVGPEKVNGKLAADFIHVLTNECTLCDHRLKENLLPRCVDNCPMGALRFCRNAGEMVTALQGGRRVQPCKIVGEVPVYL